MSEETIDPKGERISNAIIVTLLNVENLIDKGFLTGPKLLTEEGRIQAKKLQDDGFVCTQKETHYVLDWMMHPEI